MFNPSPSDFRRLLVALMLIAPAACIDFSSDSDTTGTITLQGSVGDGPVTGANVAARDALSAPAGNTRSDGRAQYTLAVSKESKFPLLLEARDGNDLVTGGAPDFTLVSAAAENASGVANLTPMSTLITRAAQDMPGGLTPNNLRRMTEIVMQDINFGLDPLLVPDPLRTQVNDANIAAILRANEALGEWFRRTQIALSLDGSPFTVDEVVGYIAADLMDGLIDGKGAAGATLRVAATAIAAAAQLHLEIITNRLKVNNADATHLMDAAIVQVEPTSASLTEDVVITESMLKRTRLLLAAIQCLLGTTALSSTNNALAELETGMTPAQARASISTDSIAQVGIAVSKAALGPESSQREVIAALSTAPASSNTTSSGAESPSDGPALSTPKYPPDTIRTVIPTPDIPRPGYLQPITDPVFHTRIVRITDDAVFGGKNIRHYYSKVEPWNADGTLIKLKSRLLDGKTYKLLRFYNNPDESRWSTTDPNRMYGVTGTSFVTLDVPSNTVKTLRQFPGFEQCFLGPWEGNLSTDNQYVALACKKASDLTVIVYNIKADSIEAQRTFAGRWPNLDWVSVSQSGKYVVINWESQGVESYDRKLNYITQLSTHGEHADLCYDTQGNEVYVASIPVEMVRLDNGQHTKLLQGDSDIDGGHVSCRNVRRPGWAYLSSDASDVFAVRLDGSHVVERFAHHHTSIATYDGEAQPVPNPDGNKVMFASTWGDKYPANSYVADMP